MAVEQKRDKPQNSDISAINDDNPRTHHDALVYPRQN